VDTAGVGVLVGALVGAFVGAFVGFGVLVGVGATYGEPPELPLELDDDWWLEVDGWLLGCELW
jgi:hypothetical protein